MGTRWLYGDDLALDNIKSTVNANFILLDTAKEIWEAIRDIYSMKKNAPQVFDVYKDLFTLG